MPTPCAQRSWASCPTCRTARRSRPERFCSSFTGDLGLEKAVLRRRKGRSRPTRRPSSLIGYAPTSEGGCVCFHQKHSTRLNIAYTSSPVDSCLSLRPFAMQGRRYGIWPCKKMARAASSYRAQRTRSARSSPFGGARISNGARTSGAPRGERSRLERLCAAPHGSAVRKRCRRPAGSSSRASRRGSRREALESIRRHHVRTDRATTLHRDGAPTLGHGSQSICGPR